MRVRVLASAILLVAACGIAFAQDDVPPKLIQLINGPSQVEIPCDIKFPKPQLMFRQQYALEVWGRFSHKEVERGSVRHLQVLLKLQDGEGRWLDGEDYDDFKVPINLQGHDIAYSALVYVRPGRYRVSMAILDTETGKANIYHRDLNISPLSNDPFPVIDELLPAAEFPQREGDARGFWLLPDHMEPIPLPHSRPTRLEIVLNITKRSRWDFLYRADVDFMLQSGSMLGRFRPANGCVRLSVIDSLRTTVVLDRFSVQRLNWTRLQEKIENINQDIIDVKILANQKKIAQFMHDYLQKVAADDGGCGKATDAAPLVVVVSPDVVLPDGNKIGGLTPLQRNVFVYIHEGSGGGWMDGIGQVLSSGKPHKIESATARDFRKALARIARMMTGDDGKPGQ